jgi:tetratricopeptide (TPR) repeat protein
MKKNIFHKNDIKNAKYALLGMIPSVEAYTDFKADMRKGFSDVMPELVDYAASCDLITERTEAALLTFLEANPVTAAGSGERRTFSGFLTQVLGMRSVNSLLENLNLFAERFRMMPIQASMFSRLKKNFNPNTPKKRNVLRLLAFWAGLKRPELGWHYEILLRLGDARPVKPVTVEEIEGIRIAFALQAAGDILDLKAVDWLKSELHQCINDLNLHYIQPNRIAFTLSTAHIDLPKAPGPSGEPRLYARAIRDSLALAYQMPIRWALSEHSSQQRSMIIAISAGPFDQADKYIQALFTAKRSGITPIRMTDFARLCAKIADIKVTFNKEVEELATGFPGAGYTKAWQVDFFWTYLYYDFVPELLAEDIMPTTWEAYEAFRNELFFPDDQADSRNKALSAIRKFPQDSLLAVEVARILIAKRMLYEADEVLSIILAAYPLHVVARTCRAIIYHYLSMYQTDPDLAEAFFARAVRETDIVESNHPEEAEAHSEAGLLYYTRAIQLLVTFRKKKSHLGRQETVGRCTDLLKNALRLFNKSAAIAPITDMRAEFWIRQARILMMMLEKDKNTLLRSRMMSDQYDIVYDISRQSFKILGWLRDDSPEAYRFFQDRLNNQMKQYAEDVSVTNFSPSLKCIFAGYMWNTLPEMTVGMAKLIIFLYQEAIQDVERLSRFNIGVYSASGCYTLIQSPDHFINNAQKYIKILEDVLQDDLDQPDDHLITRDKIRRVALPFALLDDAVKSDIILTTGGAR